MLNNFENLVKSDLDFYGLKIRIYAKEEYIDEIKKYHYEFIRENQSFKPEIEIFFRVECGEEWEKFFKESEACKLLYRKLYVINKGDKLYYLIPNKDYPFVLISQTIGFELYRILKYDIYPMHAAAVSNDNKACLLMGESKSGKTTLSLALVKSGYQYFNDDIAFLDEDNNVLQYHRAITPRIGTAKLFPELMESVHSIKYRDFDDDGIRWCVNTAHQFKGRISPNCKMKYIIFPKYNPDKEFSFKKMSLSESIIGMMKNMRIAPTVYYGNKIISKLKKMLSDEVEAYMINYPNYHIAVDFVKNLYKEKESIDWNIK